MSVDNLGEGNWYWRVTPVYAFTLVGSAPEPPARSVVVAARVAMAAPELGAPLPDSLYQAHGVKNKGLSFSWTPQAEAVSYQLIVSTAKDLSSSLATIPSSQSFLTLSGDQTAVLARAGTSYWGVRWIDAEGNVSPPSPGRPLQGVDGSDTLRLTFPPDGYRIADSLVGQTRFAWKSNLRARTIFQVAQDKDFKDVAYQESVGAETLIGHDWKSGDYYWRMKALNADGSTFLETEPPIPPRERFSISASAMTRPFPGAWCRRRTTTRRLCALRQTVTPPLSSRGSSSKARSSSTDSAICPPETTA